MQGYPYIYKNIPAHGALHIRRPAKITEFDEHYELRLDPDNRWIRLGKLLPWDEMAALYCRELSAHMGAGTVDPRHVIGAIIVKHKLGLSDTKTLDSIGEKKKKRKAYIRKGCATSSTPWNATWGHRGHGGNDRGNGLPPALEIPEAAVGRPRGGPPAPRLRGYMYDNRTNTVGHRIVSPSQPHVRPIVRGKQGRAVEFGAKLGLSLFEGHMAADTLSWDTYNESGDLKGQAKAYRALFGHWPGLIQADKIYATNEKRKWCPEKGIRLTATSKGRPVEKTRRQKAGEREEYADRNAIEGRIGNAEQVLSLNQIRAKLRETSESWIGATLFVLNLSVLAQKSGFTF